MSVTNKIYWDSVYNHPVDIPIDPSSFARDIVMPLLSPTCVLLELGCGNGRDAKYFAKHGVTVDGVDISNEATGSPSCTCGIGENTRCNRVNPHFFENDFSTVLVPLTYDVVYSRFTLHSVDAVKASKTIHNAYVNLKVGGMLCIEVRSVLDPLYGKGSPVCGEKDAFVTTHYRRFVRMHELLSELKNFGFSIVYSVESNNLSIHNQDNPVLIRIISKKE
jgi:SAM-dependent methyltransferase